MLDACPGRAAYVRDRGPELVLGSLSMPLHDQRDVTAKKGGAVLSGGSLWAYGDTLNLDC